MQRCIGKLCPNNMYLYPCDLLQQQEYYIDRGNMLGIDHRPLDVDAMKQGREEYILDRTRDNTQLLLNAIWDLPIERLDNVCCAPQYLTIICPGYQMLIATLSQANLSCDNKVWALIYKAHLHMTPFITAHRRILLHEFLSDVVRHRKTVTSLVCLVGPRCIVPSFQNHISDCHGKSEFRRRKHRRDGRSTQHRREFRTKSDLAWYLTKKHKSTDRGSDTRASTMTSQRI